MKRLQIICEYSPADSHSHTYLAGYATSPIRFGAELNQNEQRRESEFQGRRSHDNRLEVSRKFAVCQVHPIHFILFSFVRLIFVSPAPVSVPPRGCAEVADVAIATDIPDADQNPEASKL